MVQPGNDADFCKQDMVDSKYSTHLLIDKYGNNRSQSPSYDSNHPSFIEDSSRQILRGKESENISAK